MKRLFYHISTVFLIGIQVNSFAIYQKDSLLLKIKENPIDSVERKADLLLEIGLINLQNANFEKALEKHFEALKLYEILEIKPKIAKSYNQIGVIYKRNYKYELALSYFEKALIIEKTIGNIKRQGFVLGNIGVAYASLNRHEIALKYYLDSEKYLERLDDFDASSNISNIGWVYYKLEEYNKSILYYKKSIKVAKSHGNYSQRSLTLNNIGLSFIELDELDSAEAYIIKSIEICKEVKEPVNLLNALIAYSDLLRLKKDYEKSLEYLYEFVALNDSLFTLESSNAIQELQVKYETNKKIQEIKLLEHKSELETRRTQLLILGVILILTIGLFLIYRFSSQRKIMVDRMELNKLKREKLKEEISVKSSQLTNFALLTVEKNEFISTLDKHIKTLKKDVVVKENTKFKDLVASINNYTLHDKNRYLFDSQMDEAYQSFFIKLGEKYPELTQTEKKLAALLRLNLSSKEIASLMNVSSKSVDTYRYNLRKKLNLDQDDNLNSILGSI